MTTCDQLQTTPASSAADSCNVLMIYPKFSSNSFWNYAATCDLAGAKYPAAPLGLITVAALLPPGWPVRLVNRNTETLDEADLDWAHMVMVGGMLPQQTDALALIEMCRARGKPVIVGGPDATSTPEVYAAADFLVLGEAEEIMADFIAAWRAGERTGRFRRAMGETDVSKSPTPRFDLLKFDQYLHVGVQFSRGCPFNCEFCDIIELYGRVPRTKTTGQLLAELDALYALGYRGHVDFVDDNLIGNKKALRLFLPHLTRWLTEHRYPFEFSTEASVNLADDDVLLKDLAKANFFAVFVGIESPDTDTLVAMQKKQNTRRSLQESIEKIHRAGIFVNAGFIVGFDSEGGSAARGIVECIEDTAIPVCMAGLLYALPGTQLERRLIKEGRLHAAYDADDMKRMGDQCTAGLNFETLRPRRAILQDYRDVLRAIYAPEAFFGRIKRLARLLGCQNHVIPVSAKSIVRDLRSVLRLAMRMSRARPGAGAAFWKTVRDCLTNNPGALPYVIKISALYLHVGPFAEYVVGRIDEQIQDIDADRWPTPKIIAPVRTPQTTAA
jgi:radical SAM superfamily enzyme YgiQ (UPF0313 family)